ncbi:MAG: hypothetical protein WB760_26550 [Xanthobacteraceae bacterium]
MQRAAVNGPQRPRPRSLVGKLDDHLQLCLLLVLGEDVVFFGGGEAAVRGERRFGDQIQEIATGETGFGD